MTGNNIKAKILLFDLINDIKQEDINKEPLWHESE